MLRASASPFHKATWLPDDALARKLGGWLSEAEREILIEGNHGGHDVGAQHPVLASQIADRRIAV